jgi:hypothetical protein
MRRPTHVLLIAVAGLFALVTPAGSAPPIDVGRPDLVETYLAGHAAPADYPAIVQSCRTLALAGDTKGQTCLGFMYSHGHGVTQDAAQAIDWWRRAALQEDIGAQNALGSTYQFGHGVPIDCAEAARWYGMSAEQGSPFGMYNLAVMDQAGQCRPRDDIQALAWFDLALTRFPDTASQYRDSGAAARAMVAARMSADQVAQALAVEARYRVVRHMPTAKVQVLGSFPILNPSYDCSTPRGPLETYYPDRAQRLSVPGHARMACKVSASGATLACTWTEEDPPDYGFGRAAARLGCQIRFDRPTSLPASDWVASAPMRFALPPAR